MTFPILSLRSLNVWRRNRDVFRSVWKGEFPFIAAEPFLVLGIMGAGLGGYVAFGGDSYLKFIAPGLIASYAMWASGGECSWGTYIRMTQQKTFDAMIATPVGIEDVITGEVLWGATRAIISSMAVMLAAVMFGLVPSPWAVLTPLAAAVEGLMFASISIAFVSVATSFYSLNYYFALFLVPLSFLSDVFFPISGLPQWAQVLAWLTPLTHSVAITRALFSGSWEPSLLINIAWTLVLTIVFFTLAQNLMRRRLIT